MTRTDYRTTRALIRANGFYALRWMPAHHAEFWRGMRDMSESVVDWLEWRQRWMLRPDTCKTSIIRLTAPAHLV